MIILKKEWKKSERLWDNPFSLSCTLYREWVDIIFGKNCSIDWESGEIISGKRVAIPITELL